MGVQIRSSVVLPNLPTLIVCLFSIDLPRITFQGGCVVGKQILVLAKSWKEGGFCIAGPEVICRSDGTRSLSANWVRPVHPKNDGQMTGPISTVFCNQVSVLDIIRLDEPEHVPSQVQPENWRVAVRPFSRESRFTRIELLHSLAKRSGSIWSDSQTARDDQVSAATAEASGRSLMLVAPENLVFSLRLQECQYGLKQRISVSFTHEGRYYTGIPVTDPAVCRVYKNQFPRTPGQVLECALHNGDRYWLTLSLSPRWKDGNHYILAAAVVDYTGYLNRTYG